MDAARSTLSCHSARHDTNVLARVYACLCTTMEIGEHCKLSSCLVLTFLPVNCPYCRSLFCQSHFLPSQHDCKAPGAAEADRTLSETEVLKRVQRANERRREVQQGAAARAREAEEDADDAAGPSKLPCQRAGCKQFSLQLDPVLLGQSRPVNVIKQDGAHQKTKVVHAAPRCHRCRGFFCMT